MTECKRRLQTAERLNDSVRKIDKSETITCPSADNIGNAQNLDQSIIYR